MSTKEYPIVESAESFAAALARVREAQKAFSTYTQEQVDAIFLAAATAANRARIPLAKMAVEETGFGIWQDKVLKNVLGSTLTYNFIKSLWPYSLGKRSLFHSAFLHNCINTVILSSIEEYFNM